MEGKYNRKRAAAQIKIIASSKAAPANSERDTPATRTHKKEARNGVITVHKKQGKKFPSHGGAQLYFVL